MLGFFLEGGEIDMRLPPFERTGSPPKVVARANAFILNGRLAVLLITIASRGSS